MPPQTPSDRPNPEQARWNAEQARWNAERARWNAEQASRNEARTAQPQAQPPSRQGPAPEPQRPPMARRSVLRGVAGVGAVAAAAAVGAGAVVAFDRNSGTSLSPKSKPVAMAPMAPSAMAGPLVVYIADTASGLMDVFGGTGATRINNPAMIQQLMDNMKLA